MKRVCLIQAKKMGITAVSLLAMLVLSGCATTSAPHAWENVHNGHLIGNIYTGDDHI